MNKYGMVPEHSFLEENCSCVTALLPEKFYNRVEEGSIILKKVQTFCFYKDGIITDDDETSPIRTDIVIFGTGYKGDQKLKDIFVQPPFQKVFAGSLTTNVPLYRYSHLYGVLYDVYMLVLKKELFSHAGVA